MQLGRKILLATSIAIVATTTVAGIAQARTDAPNDNVAAKSATVAPDKVDAPLKATRFAVVDFEGNFIRGKNVVDVNPLTGLPGRYEVEFDRNISFCAFTASIADEGTSDEIAGVIDLSIRGGNPNAVFVETSDTSGVEDLRDFHLVVTC